MGLDGLCSGMMRVLLCLLLLLMICMFSNADADLPSMAKSTKALTLPAVDIVTVFDTPTILLGSLLWLFLVSVAN